MIVAFFLSLLTFFLHANTQTLLESTRLTVVARHMVNAAVTRTPTEVLAVLAHASPEEALARLAGNSSEVLA